MRVEQIDQIIRFLNLIPELKQKSFEQRYEFFKIEYDDLKSLRLAARMTCLMNKGIIPDDIKNIHTAEAQMMFKKWSILWDSELE